MRGNEGTATGHLESCTIVGNLAYRGGGLHVNDPRYFVTNCIVASNTALSSYADLYESAYVTNIYYSCVPRNTKVLLTQGNITNEPSFQNAAEHKFGLRPDSPCINKGFNSPWMEDACDMDGRPRLDKFSRLVDMGCYEHVPAGSMFKLY